MKNPEPQEETEPQLQSHIHNLHPKSARKPALLRLRILVSVLTVLVCSLSIRTTTIETLRHSRDLHRVLNRQLLLHTDLDIYWFGYRAGQYLINYPIQEYYFVSEVGLFLQRVERVLGGFREFCFGGFDQQQFNRTTQGIKVYGIDGQDRDYNWTVGEGFRQPFTSDDNQVLKDLLINSLSMEIRVEGIKIGNPEDSDEDDQVREWGLSLVVETFSKTSIYVTVVLHEDLYLGYQHIWHLVLGIATLILFAIQIESRYRKTRLYNPKRKPKGRLHEIQPSDTPDFLVIFFLIYSSFAALTNLFSLRYILLMDGVTCFICWLYILKLNTENQSYHISFLIKKCYIFVGRLFVSFGPLFIGFCLFALTAFCRYTDLFVSFHKTFISLFCVCYYNMTYQQFRTTERTNPISTIFFTSLIMIFTICIYSGMLVSVFCSYMWNRRENKNKEELMEMLKIQCLGCGNRYGYGDGYQASVEMSVRRSQAFQLQGDVEDGDEDDPDSYAKYRSGLREKVWYLCEKVLEISDNNELTVEFTDNQNGSKGQEVEKELIKQLKQNLNSINLILDDLSNEL